MDRQHPRDLFDVKELLETRGIDRSIFIGFLAYLLSHNRPISEVMNPRWKDISDVYKKEFDGMTFKPISLEELQTVPSLMLQSLKAQFTQSDFDFLYSFKSGEPDWTLSPHSHIQNGNILRQCDKVPCAWSTIHPHLGCKMKTYISHVYCSFL